MTPKKLNFKVGDEVVTTKDHDYQENEVFPIGTKGVITYINEKSSVPYKVEAENGEYWFYSDDMLKDDNEEYTDEVEELDIEAYLIAGEVLEKAKGNGGKIREIIYHLNNFMRYKGV